MSFANDGLMNISDPQGLSEAFHSAHRVEGLTHRFYRYPARFSPQFVRHVIAELSEPGDTILDPFMGGGTTIVEALAAGRRAVGIDINALSHFVTRVKTTPLSERDAAELVDWAGTLKSPTAFTCDRTDVGTDRRTKNLPEEVRRFFKAPLQSMGDLRFPRQRRFARCVLLRVGQWALEDRRYLPTTEEILRKLRAETEDMLAALGEFVDAARTGGLRKNKITRNRLLTHSSVIEPAIQGAIRYFPQMPKLVLTSPPYPGVHVLYHRWQVSGRRETPAPYWLADLRDGQGESYYTMGSRSHLGMLNYFATLRRGFQSLKAAISPDATVVQLVAFSNTNVQLPLYMEALDAAGYQEVEVAGLSSSHNLVRTVPHRKWYTNGQKTADASQEVMLVHQPRTNLKKI